MVRAVFPGTFDPVHYGHIDIANRASRIFNELIIAVYDTPPKDLLFSADERLEMVRKAFADNERIRASIFSGLIVNYCRDVEANVIVRGLRVFSDFEHEFRMALANHRLDSDIDVVLLITSEEHSFLTGSTVKEIASLSGDVTTLVPDFVRSALTKRFQDLGDDGPNIVPMTSLRD
ncbi:MAG: pantetheine-phosphate adenylyltransferase [Anaerolineales bacterium]|nr:pantetheine-phosphate adenylyltransferase [Anaerolineales bacterium]MCK5634358.1 pantetheine-phosphate adenylyltransferase [Anaerolineales bacterium]